MNTVKTQVRNLEIGDTFHDGTWQRPGTVSKSYFVYRLTSPLTAKVVEAVGFPKRHIGKMKRFGQYTTIWQFQD